jgi:gluconolactonase
MNPSWMRNLRLVGFALAGSGTLLFTACSKNAGGESWREQNESVARKYAIHMRERSVPETGVPAGIAPGKATPLGALPKTTLADGVTANLGWSKGALLEILEMQKGAAYPEQKLGEELLTVVREGSAVATVDGKTLELPPNSVLYLTPGTQRSLRAGPKGMKAIEAFSPARVDLLNLAGAKVPSGASVSFPDQGMKPSIEPGRVYNLDEIQFTPITDPLPSVPYKRSAANSRIVWGRNVMLSFVRMDPGSIFPEHNHPEHQLMMVLRGALVQGVMDAPAPMAEKTNDVILMPGGMVHSAKMSEFGADALDVFWPARTDYAQRAEAQNALLRQVIEPGAKPVKVADGFTFTEGPTWLKGRLFFSDMYFKDPGKGDWTGSPARSRLISMDPAGKWRVVAKGMQTNGTVASRTGNLLVCDMFGHRVIEMDPGGGKVMATVLETIGGKPIDGPNDLVMDAKGGVYVSDPQFTPESKKSQPGKQVYYIGPDGSAKVVIPAGEYAMPNGVEISPDGRTFYVNNTWLQPGENYLYAYDIQPDGSLTNKRKFAVVNLTGTTLSAPEPINRYDSRADGMAVDMDGRIYVATLMGVQIFDRTGAYVGNIWCPQYPVSCTFGDKDSSTLYMVGEKEVWAIPTKVKGFRLPKGME